MTQWIEDWFGSKYYSLLYQYRDDTEAKKFIDYLLAALKIQLGSTILDCGCGQGRHSIYLNRKGYNVTGVDISEGNILQSKKYENNKLTFIKHDLRELFRDNYFDVALSLFTSFGYYEEDTENNKVIKSISQSLKKGGVFVLDYLNAVHELRELIPEEEIKKDGIIFKVRRHVDSNNIIKNIMVNDDNKQYSFHENVKNYHQKDFEKFFFENNLDIVYLFGDYDLRPYVKQSSERLIIVGKKK